MTGAIFWTIVVAVVMNKFFKFLDGELYAMRMKSYFHKAEEIDRKYYPHSYSFEPRERELGVYEKYNNELNELKRQYGLKEYEYKGSGKNNS